MQLVSGSNYPGPLSKGDAGLGLAELGLQPKTTNRRILRRGIPEVMGSGRILVFM